MYVVGINTPKKLYKIIVMHHTTHYLSKLVTLVRSHIPNSHHTIIDNQWKTKQKIQSEYSSEKQSKKNEVEIVVAYMLSGIIIIRVMDDLLNYLNIVQCNVEILCEVL